MEITTCKCQISDTFKEKLVKLAKEYDSSIEIQTIKWMTLYDNSLDIIYDDDQCFEFKLTVENY